MNILSKLSKVLSRFPIKTILIALIIVILLAVGVRNVFMATGNDTLVKSDTNVYKDNLKLEEEFGGESILVLYEAEELLTPSHLEHMKGIEINLQANDSIYTIISPVTLVEEIATNQSDQFQDGIADIIDGLDDMGNKLMNISKEFGGKTQVADMAGISEQLTDVAGSLSSISANIEDSSMKTQLVEASQKLNALSMNMLEGAVAPSTIPSQTIDESNKAQEQLDKPTSQSKGLAEMGEQLKSISVNMETIKDYSDIMTPGLPKKQATLDNMIYEDGKLRTMFEEVVIDNNHMIMMIKFNGSTSDAEKSDVVNTINTYLDTESIDSAETIVSGKPVLDNGIRSSMQESIKQMMGIALLIMIVILFFVFKSRWRLLPLLTVLIAVVGTIGLMGWLQIPITMVSMAVFPILIGLGIDYAIQFQTRYTEEFAKEDSNE